MNEADSATARPGRRLSGFSLARQWRLTAKELAETLRDRRTIVTLLVMPLLVYPLLSIIFRQFLSVSLNKPGQNLVYIGVDDERQGVIVLDLMTVGDQALQRMTDDGRHEIEPALIEEPRLEDFKFDIGRAE